MSGGEHKKPQSGYTIVEVLIFLAISAVMFVIAASFIYGKQAAAQFTQGVNGFASSLQSTLQEVADGQYTSLDTLSCSTTSGSPVLSSTSGNGQGSNNDCVFLGKVIHLSEGGDATKYEVLSVAGSRLDSTGNVNTTLAGAQPTALAGGPLDALVLHHIIPQTLSVTGIKVTAASGGTTATNVYAFALLTNPAVAVAGGSLTSGAQSVDLYYVNNVGANDDTAHVTSAITSANLKLAKQVDICFFDTGNRQAAVTIGTNNNHLAVTVNRGNGVTPCS